MELDIEVCYATATKQILRPLRVAQGTTVLTALQQSGILEDCFDIDITRQAVGIFSRIVALTDCVQAGDRLEIYRPLQIDPKTARRLRAQKQPT